MPKSNAVCTSQETLHPMAEGVLSHTFGAMAHGGQRRWPGGPRRTLRPGKIPQRRGAGRGEDPTRGAPGPVRPRRSPSAQDPAEPRQAHPPHPGVGSRRAPQRERSSAAVCMAHHARGGRRPGEQERHGARRVARGPRRRSSCAFASWIRTPHAGPAPRYCGSFVWMSCQREQARRIWFFWTGVAGIACMAATVRPSPRPNGSMTQRRRRT